MKRYRTATLALAFGFLVTAATMIPTPASAEPLKACGKVSRGTGEVPERSAVHLRRECRPSETELGEVDPESTPLDCVGRLWAGGTIHVYRTGDSLCESYGQWCLHTEGPETCGEPHIHFVAVCCTTPAIVSIDAELPEP